MRIWGRQYASDGSYTWIPIETDSSGNSDYCYITALIQCFKLNLNESPFWSNYGIPAQESVMQQIAPDYYVSRIQSQYAPFFANLMISRDQTATDPTYNVNILTHQGVPIQLTIAV